MTSGTTSEQIAVGYKMAREGINEGQLEDWFLSESDNENRGALAALAFYGACIRECMCRGVDNPTQAHIVAGAIIEFYEKDDFESVIGYLIGNPLPSRVGDVVENFKVKFQSLESSTLKMLDETADNMEIRFDDDLDWEPGS